MEKKGLMSLIVALVLLFSLTSVFGSAVAAEEKPITLSFATFFPPSHFMCTKVIPQYIKEVEKATNGRVKIVVYPAGTLLKAPETYDGVVAGTADIGNSVPAYTRGRFPVLEGFELPGIYFGSCAATTMVATDGVKKFQPKELQDTKPLIIFSVGPGSLYSKKEVKSLDDVKGMRIRATGLTAKSIKALGAIPVAMPMPEVYEALSKGVIDGTIAPPEVLKGWKQAEVTDYITILPPVYNSLQYFVMNKDKWNSLPKDIQEAINKVNEGFALKTGLIWDSEMKENGIDYGIKEHGMKLNRLSEADNAKAMALMQPILDDYVARMNKKGLPGQEILDFTKEKAAKYSKMYPPGY